MIKIAYFRDFTGKFQITSALILIKSDILINSKAIYLCVPGSLSWFR